MFHISPGENRLLTAGRLCAHGHRVPASPRPLLAHLSEAMSLYFTWHNFLLLLNSRKLGI